MTEGGKEAMRTDGSVVSAAEARELKKRIRELERVLRPHLLAYFSYPALPNRLRVKNALAA